MRAAAFRSSASAGLLAVAVLLGGCSGVEEDAPLAQAGAAEAEKREAKESARVVTAGVLAEGESDCIIDKMFARSDVTARQVLDFAERPDPSSPVAAVYNEVVPQCIDPSATVAPRELSPELRKGYVAGIKSGAPSMTDQQAECLLDNLLGQGVTARDLTLAGYDQQLFASKMEPLLPAAAAACGLSG